MGPHPVDTLAVGFFIIEWLVYAVTLEWGVDQDEKSRGVKSRSSTFHSP
jgi:hypothetical protein